MVAKKESESGQDTIETKTFDEIISGSGASFVRRSMAVHLVIADSAKRRAWLLQNGHCEDLEAAADSWNALTQQ